MEGFVLVGLGGLDGADGTLLAGGAGVPRVVGREVRWYYRSVAVFDRVVGVILTEIVTAERLRRIPSQRAYR